jgi:hypothetical protein
VLEVEPGSGLIKFMRALGRWVRSFRRSKPKGMAGEGRVGSRDEVGKGCGAKGDAHSESANAGVSYVACETKSQRAFVIQSLQKRMVKFIRYEMN